MALKSTLLLAATTVALLAGAQSAEAKHRWIWLPGFYDPYVDDEPFYGDEYAYVDPYLDEEPVYVPRRKQRYVQDGNAQWWIDPPARKRLQSGHARALEPTYQPAPRKLKPKDKRLASVAPVPKPTLKTSKPAPSKLPAAASNPDDKPPVKLAAKPVTSKSIGCTAGAAVVTGYGFANVTPKTCTGSIYAYNATRDGKPFIIKLTAAQGEITDVTRQ